MWNIVRFLLWEYKKESHIIYIDTTTRNRGHINFEFVEEILKA